MTIYKDKLSWETYKFLSLKNTAPLSFHGQRSRLFLRLGNVRLREVGESMELSPQLSFPFRQRVNG